MKVKVNNSLYSREAISAALYQYSGNNYVSQNIDVDNPMYTVIEIASKDGNEDQISDRLFLNVLNDYQVRCDLENRFGYIRNQLVEEAFKPIIRSEK